MPLPLLGTNAQTMATMGKGSKIYSIFGIKCPHCHETGMFETGSFSFKKSFDMKSHCEVCGQDFEPEPGFYYGAMFISYIFTAFFCLGFTFFVHWVLDISLMGSFALLMGVLAILFVYIFRLARSIWIHLNVGYDPNAGKKGK